jgi:hypothetical protein
MIVHLSSDLLTQIRSFLALNSFEDEILQGNVKMKQYVRQEMLRSGRNLLSVSNSVDWKSIRRSTMIWSLNRHISSKFLKDENFRNYIKTRMEHPRQQLKLCFDKFIDPPMEETFSQLGVPSIHSLSVNHSGEIDALSGFRKIYYLKLSHCGFPSAAGLEDVTCLSLSSVPESFYLTFPLDSLQHLSLDEKFLNSFLNSMQHLKQLTTLCLIADRWAKNSDLPLLPLPQLEKLDVSNFTSIDITGLHLLTELSVGKNKPVLAHNPKLCKHIRGKEEIFPQLFSFVGPFISMDDLALLKNVKSLKAWYPTEEIIPLTNNIPDLSISIVTPRSSVTDFVVGEKMKKLMLIDFGTVDLSTMANLQELSLIQCLNVKDIRCLQRIPYLMISQCVNIVDYSPLGRSQRYLELHGCDQLKDEDLLNFGNVPYLEISKCNKINKIELSSGNLYFYGIHSSLTEVVLNGFQFVKVEVKLCRNLTRIAIHGKVHSLNISDCLALNPPDVENCDFFQDLGKTGNYFG